MRTEALGHLNISKDITGNRTRDVQSYGAVSQPTAPQVYISRALNVCERGTIHEALYMYMCVCVDIYIYVHTHTHTHLSMSTSYRNTVYRSA
jgi:hypothetical protein